MGDSPFSQRLRNGVQDIHITLESVVESRCIDQYNRTAVHCERFRNLDLFCT